MNRWTPEQARTRIRSALLELLEPRQLYEADGHHHGGRQRWREGWVQPDLLSMLSDAAAPGRAGGDSTGTTSSFESRPPVSMAAVAVWDTIRREARRWSIELTGVDGDPGASELRAEATRIQRSRNRLAFDRGLVEGHIGVLVQVLTELRMPVRNRARVYLLKPSTLKAELARYEQRSADLSAAIATCDQLLEPLATRIAQLDGPRGALLNIGAAVAGANVMPHTLARLDRAVTGGGDADGGWLREARVAVGLDPDPVTVDHPCPHCGRRRALTVATDDDGPRAWCNSCGMAWPSHLVPLLVAQVGAVRVAETAAVTRAEQLREIRAGLDASGRSHQWLAEQMGTSRQYVSQVLAGRKAANGATLERMLTIATGVGA